MKNKRQTPPQNKLIKLLSDINVFKTFNTDQLKHVLEKSQHRFFEAGEYLIKIGSENTDVYFLLSGKVRVITTSASGREIGFEEIEKGDIFGELSAIDGLPRSNSIVALNSLQTCFMTQDNFLKLLRDNSDLNAAVMHRMSRVIRLLTGKVLELGTFNARQRIYAELVRLAQMHLKNEHRVEIAPSPTHSEIANMIGLQRETVTREFNCLKELGILEDTPQKKIIITNFQLLRELAEKSLNN